LGLGDSEINVATRNTFDPTAISLPHQTATSGQRNLALAVVLFQFVACGVVAPIVAPVPRIDGFIPVILTIVFIADLITAVLLFNQSSVAASRALLVLANGYLFSALIVVPHALTFPGAFAAKGLLGAGVQSSGWLNVFWHFGFLAAIAGYACLKDGKRRNDAIPSSALFAFSCSAAIQFSFVCTLTWAVTAGDRFMPRIFLDDLTNAPLLYDVTGSVVLTSVLVLLLMWTRRTSTLDLWVMVSICMMISEMTLVTFGLTVRFYLGWYVSRALAVGVSTVVLVALLSESMRLYAALARANLSLEQLNAELDHRAKNLLARVAAVAKYAVQRDRSVDEFIEALDRRIESMATAHSLLSQSRWREVSLVDVVRGQLAPYTTQNNTVISGRDLTLHATATQALAMVLQELVTNAAKYGSLSTPQGKVLVSWERRAGPDGTAHVAIAWRETDGPPVTGPKNSSYGTNLIRGLIPRELGGSVDLVFPQEGLRCDIEIPLAAPKEN